MSSEWRYALGGQMLKWMLKQDPEKYRTKDGFDQVRLGQDAEEAFDAPEGEDMGYNLAAQIIEEWSDP